jgi:leader peptidase (prepilin peptidase)/N-methyltransferase
MLGRLILWAERGPLQRQKLAPVPHLRHLPAAQFARGRKGMSAYDWISLALVAVLSVSIGSFVAALALRLPAGDTLGGRSRCPLCRHVLTPRDLVPLASWAVLRGRCRHCGGTIGVYYPAVELAALALALWAWTAVSGWLLAATAIFGWTLLALTLIDYKHFILPDVLTLPLVPAGLAVNWWSGAHPLLDSALGALFGYLAFALVAWVYRRWRGREGMGAGDAKLLAGLGAWVGATGLPGVVLLASVLALAAALVAHGFRGRLSLAERLPFGPFLAAAGWVVWLYGPLFG